jgi:hypothetical protein
MALRDRLAESYQEHLEWYQRALVTQPKDDEQGRGALRDIDELRFIAVAEYVLKQDREGFRNYPKNRPCLISGILAK